MVAPSCPFFHVPLDVQRDQKLDEEFRSWMALAARKLVEIRALADEAASDSPRGWLFQEARAAHDQASITEVRLAMGSAFKREQESPYGR
jgi:hypothetical protein